MQSATPTAIIGVALCLKVRCAVGMSRDAVAAPSSDATIPLPLPSARSAATSSAS